MAGERVDVRKTYKLFVGGAFPRSESGRVYAVQSTPTRKGAATRLLANAAAGSRKDARDAVVAAKAAFAGWSGTTAYNRGQVLYRVAEVMEGRREQFAAQVADSEGLTSARAETVVSQAIDRWVWYAGWTDKLAQVLGGANPVAGPYFNLSVPDPLGVVAVQAPQASSLLGFVSVVAPVIATGNTCVVVTSHRRPLPAITLAECLATSDLPAGVVNILTGDGREMLPWLASHRDVGGLDLAGVAGWEDAPWAEWEAAAADTLTRVRRPARGADGSVVSPDYTAEPSLAAMTAFVETKTVWHPKGR